MTNEKLPEIEKVFTAPNLFNMLRRSDADTQFLLAKLRAVVELPSKWRTELPGSDIAERCASELETALVQPKKQGEQTMTDLPDL
jgi:hypothetical protein